jgi:hypothetical protein
MTNRPSVVVLMFRYFVTIFILMFLVSLFWNVLSGTNMFPFRAVIGVSVVLTVLFNIVGWVVVTLGGELILRNDNEYQEWKAKGGRPYLDHLGWPINPTPPEDQDNN